MTKPIQTCVKCNAQRSIPDSMSIWVCQKCGNHNNNMSDFVRKENAKNAVEKLDRVEIDYINEAMKSLMKKYEQDEDKFRFAFDLRNKLNEM